MPEKTSTQEKAAPQEGRQGVVGQRQAQQGGRVRPGQVDVGAGTRGFHAGGSLGLRAVTGAGV